jgi:hypothetical protein
VSKEGTRRNNTRRDYLRRIVAGLQARGLDITTTPLSLELVKQVLAVSDEIISQMMMEEGMEPLGPDDQVFETYRLLNEESLTGDALARVTAIFDANERAWFDLFSRSTANGEAESFNEYMNRGNARGELGRIG